MSVVTRNTLWFSAGDIPYVDFEVKGLQLFFNFSKSLTYCVPDGKKKALWPGGPKVAKEDGISLQVKDWSWWLIADDSIEMSCSYSDAFGPQLAFYNAEKGIQMTLPVTEAEAKEIRKAVKDMMGDHALKRDFSIKVLEPSYKVIAYPVEAYRWKATKAHKSKDKHTPVWNPTIEGYRV